MRNFWLNRIEDESGVSGVGIVAEGTQFDNGKCVLAWVTQFQTVAVYNSIDEIENIHGHNGKTVIVWSHLTQRATDLPEAPRKFTRCPECGSVVKVVYDPVASREREPFLLFVGDLRRGEPVTHSAQRRSQHDAHRPLR
jgi:hypothetical protein